MIQLDPEQANRNIAFECAQLIHRAGIAYRYLMDTFDQDDAYSIQYDCMIRAGSYPLEYLDESTVLDLLLDEYQDHPALEALVHAACQRVWSKWDSTGHAANAAEDWALDLVRHYAKQDGVPLIATTYCQECGGPMFIGGDGSAHHGSPRRVRVDDDADHPALAEPDPSCPYCHSDNTRPLSRAFLERECLACTRTY